MKGMEVSSEVLGKDGKSVLGNALCHHEAL